VQVVAAHNETKFSSGTKNLKKPVLPKVGIFAPGKDSGASGRLHESPRAAKILTFSNTARLAANQMAGAQDFFSAFISVDLRPWLLFSLRKT
jgi:hypothetical protein